VVKSSGILNAGVEIFSQLTEQDSIFIEEGKCGIGFKNILYTEIMFGGFLQHAIVLKTGEFLMELKRGLSG